MTRILGCVRGPRRLPDTLYHYRMPERGYEPRYAKLYLIIFSSHDRKRSLIERFKKIEFRVPKIECDMSRPWRDIAPKLVQFLGKIAPKADRKFLSDWYRRAASQYQLSMHHNHDVCGIWNCGRRAYGRNKM